MRPLRRTALFDVHRALGRADRAVRRLRDAGAVRGHLRRARRGAQARRAVRSLAHGAVRAARRRRRGLGRRAHRQPRRDDEAAASALQHLHQRRRRRARRRDLLPARRSLALGRQRRQRGQDVGATSGGAPRRRRADEPARRARADRDPRTAQRRDRSRRWSTPTSPRSGTTRAPRCTSPASARDRGAHRLHRRGRLRGVRRRPTLRRGVWDALLAGNRAARSRRAVSARATCCGSRPGCRSTVTS